jgi:hypothetical protein
MLAAPKLNNKAICTKYAVRSVATLALRNQPHQTRLKPTPQQDVSMYFSLAVQSFPPPTYTTFINIADEFRITSLPHTV